jgi:hypothetical protein
MTRIDANLSRLRPSLVVLTLSLLVACAGPQREGGWPEGERIFHADPRWLGGDAAISIPLSGARILWLFGDSFVDLEPPYRRSEAAFPRNTVAIQDGADPRKASMTFVWRRENDAPVSFFADDGKAWFWPGGGVRLADGTLAIFLHRVMATNAAPPLGFETRGYAVALVANPGDPPADWTMRRIDGPVVPFEALPGAAIHNGGHIVALAVRARDHAGTFVRYREDDLARGELGGAEWWAGDRGWLAAGALGPAGPVFVLPDAGAESSIHWDACARAFVHVASRGFGASDVVMQQADRLTGPWTPLRVVFRPPESADAAPFVYAAKGHAELETPGQRSLAITYIASSFDPDVLITPEGQRDLYWPRTATVAAPVCR